MVFILIHWLYYMTISKDDSINTYDYMTSMNK